ncbi:hypothetical protein [uncultured Cohaesibacter sp.]|uniref:hypothetical protein n=1 Tax=uncultured Cohaesibacter sp. TaxID=1002546 RepID=UPI0029C83CDF|nr:hypothetical protein [uncultured Cohaesibacter sp.]
MTNYFNKQPDHICRRYIDIVQHPELSMFTGSRTYRLGETTKTECEQDPEMRLRWKLQRSAEMLARVLYEIR